MVLNFIMSYNDTVSYSVTNIVEYCSIFNNILP